MLPVLPAEVKRWVPVSAFHSDHRYDVSVSRATYRYLIFGPDRQELKQNLSKFYSKISGKAQ